MYKYRCPTCDVRHNDDPHIRYHKIQYTGDLPVGWIMCKTCDKARNDIDNDTRHDKTNTSARIPKEPEDMKQHGLSTGLSSHWTRGMTKQEWDARNRQLAREERRSMLCE